MTINVDFGLTADDYARHRAGFPDSFFDHLAGRGIGVAGQTVIDLGTGAGTIARGMARRGCRVTGVDITSALLDQARRLDAEVGVHVHYVVAPAEITGLPAASADVVTAGQCWHWFDRPAAAREVRRLLKPGGRIVIAHFDWLPLAGNVVEATERLIEQHNSAWRFGGGSGLYPAWLRDLAEAGFGDLETFSYDLLAPYSHIAWRGRIRASAGVGASLAPEAVTAFDRDLAAALAARDPDPLAVPHRVWAVIGSRPSV